jgi:RNA polymerase sigma-70 factor (subfamily 1)
MNLEQGRPQEIVAGGENSSDESLIRSAKSGNEDSLRVLFERYSHTLEWRVRRRLPASLARKVSVSDVIQETRLIILRHYHRFEDRGEGSFRNWLLTIVDRKIAELTRRHAGTAKRDAGREISRGHRADTAQFVGGGPSPSQEAIASELADIARTAMETLPEDYREVLRLAREEMLPLREVGVRMGRSRDAAKKLYWRAIQRFKEEFEALKGDTRG